MAQLSGPARATLSIDSASRRAMLDSLASLEPHLAQVIVDPARFGLEGPGVDLGDLVAVRADELLVSFEPTDRCLRLFAAVAAGNVDLDDVEVETRHGWPILSSECCSATIAGRGEVASLALEGRAA